MWVFPVSVSIPVDSRAVGFLRIRTGQTSLILISFEVNFFGVFGAKLSFSFFALHRSVCSVGMFKWKGNMIFISKTLKMRMWVGMRLFYVDFRLLTSLGSLKVGYGELGSSPILIDFNQFRYDGFPDDSLVNNFVIIVFRRKVRGSRRLKPDWLVKFLTRPLLCLL